jgi:hypothetical protein
MIAAGTLPITIIRGIDFDGIILQCRDDSVAVSGTLSPAVSGTYIPSGTFGNYQLYILSGAPATFLYFNLSVGSYIIARTLTTGGISNYWTPAAPITTPSGTYLPQGTNTGTATVTDHPVDLTGYGVQAVVRRTDKAELYMDLMPSITDAVNGEITIPPISNYDTNDLPYPGTFKWDLILTIGIERFGPFIKGPVTVLDNITQISPP